MKNAGKTTRDESPRGSPPGRRVEEERRRKEREGEKEHRIELYYFRPLAKMFRCAYARMPSHSAECNAPNVSQPVSPFIFQPARCAVDAMINKSSHCTAAYNEIHGTIAGGCNPDKRLRARAAGCRVRIASRAATPLLDRRSVDAITVDYDYRRGRGES